jgi:hypothetical protein
MENKVDLDVLVIENETVCAKCCKTVQLIDRMMEELPELKKNINLTYHDLNSQDVTNKFGKLEGPVILINHIIFSEGHVPIMKKLVKSLQDNIANSFTGHIMN